MVKKRNISLKTSARRLLAVLTLALVLCVGFPVTARAVNYSANIGEGNVTISIASGVITIVANNLNLPITPDDMVTIEGSSSTNRVVIESDGSVAAPIGIRLSNVTIDMRGTENPAVELRGSVKVNLALFGDSTLYGGGESAALQVPAGTELTIAGESNMSAYTLTAIANGAGAGIGGSGGAIYDAESSGDAGTITINSGSVSAYSSVSTDETKVARGAGIGSGYDGDATVIINGGVVNASCSQNSIGTGAGIGSGESGDATVTINGGTITASSSQNGIVATGAGIGSGSFGVGTVTINGGNVCAFIAQTGLGDGYGAIGSGKVNDETMNAGAVTINGGSVRGEIRAGGITQIVPRPKDAAGEPLYQLTATITDCPNTKVIELLGLPGYGIEHMATDADAKLYLWMPAGGITGLEAIIGPEMEQMKPNDTVWVSSDNEAVATFVKSYELTVQNGSGSGKHYVGEEVPITADAPPAGQEFDSWTATAGTFADAGAAATMFTMPAEDCTVTASYRDVRPIEGTTITDHVGNGTDAEIGFAGNYRELNSVTLAHQDGTMYTFTLAANSGQTDLSLDGTIVGTVAQDGVTVTLHAAWLDTLPAGSYTLTAGFNDGVVQRSGSAGFTITHRSVTGFKLAQSSIRLTKGKTATIGAVVYYSDGTSDSEGLTWESSKPSVAMVDPVTGKITAAKNLKKDDKATITATAGDGRTATVKVTVLKKSAKAVKVTKVTLSGAKKTLDIGKTLQLKAKVSPKNATNAAVTWKSSKPGVLSVDATGKITALKEGTAKITVKAGSEKRSVTIKVTAPVKSIKVDKKSVSLAKKGKTVIVTPTVTYSAEGYTAKLSWKSSDTKVATVKNGKITAKGKGKATITVSAANGKKATVRVTVKK